MLFLENRESYMVDEVGREQEELFGNIGKSSRVRRLSESEFNQINAN
jgi:hypothetical protein